jgi:uncharacterized transporter YbjL
VVIAFLLKLSPALARTLPALTCTPPLAAVWTSASHLARRRPLASVGYGFAYPFSMIGMVLLIQFCRPCSSAGKTEERRA